MDLNKQTQKAGDNSIQTIADIVNNNHTVNYYVGVTEERVRQIFDEKIPIAIRVYTEEAKKTATERISKLEELVIKKFQSNESTFNAFADPAFQLTLIEAEKSASITDKEEKYNLLADLLFKRAETNDPEGSDALAINKAIEISGKIPLNALRGLVLIYMMRFITPCALDFEKRLNVYRKIFGNIVKSLGIPSGLRWIEDLYLLQLISIDTQSSFKKMIEFLGDRFNVLVTGLSESDPKLNEVRNELVSKNIPLDLLKPHPLKPGYLIFDLPTKLEDIKIQYKNKPEETFPLTLEQQTTLNELLKKVNVDASFDDNLKDSLLEEWNKSESLKRVTELWDSLPYYFDLTPSGRAIGNAVLHSKYPELPITF